MTLPNSSVFNFYEGTDPQHYTDLTGVNLNAGVNALLANDVAIKSAVDNLEDNFTGNDAKNALKLGGKSLEEIGESANTTSKVLQVVVAPDLGQHTISVPNYDNDKANFRQFGNAQALITTTEDNSSILVMVNGQIKQQAEGSHSYFDIKCNDVWISGHDGVYADHGMTGDESNPVATMFTYSPNVPKGTDLTFTFWGGDWGGGTMDFNTYSSSNSNGDAHGQCTLMEVVL